MERCFWIYLGSLTNKGDQDLESMPTSGDMGLHKIYPKDLALTAILGQVKHIPRSPMARWKFRATKQLPLLFFFPRKGEKCHGP